MKLDTSIIARNKMALLSIAILLATVFIGYNFIYKVGAKKASRIKAQIVTQEKTNKLLSEIQQLQQRVKSLHERQAAEPDTEWLLANVSEIARQCKVKISSIQPQSPTQNGHYIIISCRVAITSPYHRMGEFISKLESSKEFIKVGSINLSPLLARTSPAPKKAQEPTLLEEGIMMRANLEISSFYVKTN